MKRIFLFITISVFLFTPLVRAEEIVLTLDEAFTLALRDNRDILLKEEELLKEKAKIAEAYAGLLPSLDFTASVTDTGGYYTEDLTQGSTQTTLKQYLYKGGKTINTIQYNKYNFAAAGALLDKTKLETLLSVQKAFYTLLLAGEFANLNKEILYNTQEHLDFLKARYASGEVSFSEVLNIESSLASVKEAYEDSLNQAEAGASVLKNLLYLDEEIIFKPKGEFNYQVQEAAYDQAFLEAIEVRPEIKQYEAEVEAKKKSIEIARADSAPSIYASWDYYSRSHSAAGSRNWNDYNILGLTFSWPIFDGWATKAKVEQAIVDLKEAQLTKEKAIKDIALELKNAYLDLKNALSKIASAESEVDLYKNNLVVARDKYNAGIASSLDLDDVTLAYQVVLFKQKQAVNDYILAKASFEKATGGL